MEGLGGGGEFREGRGNWGRMDGKGGGVRRVGGN